jgi:hypothetical protein
MDPNRKRTKGKKPTRKIGKLKNTTLSTTPSSSHYDYYSYDYQQIIYPNTNYYTTKLP